jgi:hypothetical protein
MSVPDNAYIANSSNVRMAAEIIHKIAAMSSSIMNDFADEERSTAGWEGDDSYGRSLQPHTAQQRAVAVDTGHAVSQAIEGIANGSVANAENILRTQGANLEAIHQAQSSDVGNIGRKS